MHKLTRKETGECMIPWRAWSSPVFYPLKANSIELYTDGSKTTKRTDTGVLGPGIKYAQPMGASCWNEP